MDETVGHRRPKIQLPAFGAAKRNKNPSYHFTLALSWPSPARHLLSYSGPPILNKSSCDAAVSMRRLSREAVIRLRIFKHFVDDSTAIVDEGTGMQDLGAPQVCGGPWAINIFGMGVGGRLSSAVPLAGVRSRIYLDQGDRLAGLKQSADSGWVIENVSAINAWGKITDRDRSIASTTPLADAYDDSSKLHK